MIASGAALSSSGSEVRVQQHSVQQHSRDERFHLVPLGSAEIAMILCIKKGRVIHVTDLILKLEKPKRTSLSPTKICRRRETP
jgi:hypothetical protein